MFFNSSILLNTKQGEMRNAWGGGRWNEVVWHPRGLPGTRPRAAPRIRSTKEFTSAHKNHNRVEVKLERSRSEVHRALPRLALMIGTNPDQDRTQAGGFSFLPFVHPFSIYSIQESAICPLWQAENRALVKTQ